MHNRKIFDNVEFKIGMYIRLSREDGDDLESESITNQRSLLTGFLKANGFAIVDEYVDDGYTGTNFERPGFKRLLSDINNGHINMVITKDLSRLGRDHIMTGYYVENFFPENNIRYIAVNDDIDTFYETSASEMMPFKLSMNDMYAKDISKKVRTNLLQMKRDGKFCGSVPAYGYKRSKEDKHKLIIDSKTAPVVKKIFELYIAGFNTTEIAEILTRKEIPTPIMLKNSEKKLIKCNHPEIWKSSSVNNILKNKCYLGTLIQHTTEKINYKVKKRKDVPKSEWCVKLNAHEPIITEEEYNIAQTIRNHSNNYNSNRRCVKYLFSNLMYCKDCGAKMTISYDKKRDRVSINCNNYRKFSKYGICSSHFMNYQTLEKIILDKLKSMTWEYRNNKDEFAKIIQKDYIDPREELNNKITKLKKDIQINRLKQDALYNDKFNNVINTETYQRLFNQIENDIFVVNKKINKYQKELSNIKEDRPNYSEYNTVIEDFLKMKNPTKEMVNKLIKKIFITKDRKIEIHYRIMKSEVG